MSVGHDHGGAFWRSPAGLALCVFLAGAAVLLVLEHGAHLLGAWPWLLLLYCIGMHVFMHRGHGSHESHGSGGRSRDENKGQQ